MGIEHFGYSATQTLNGSYILGGVVGDSHVYCMYELLGHAHPRSLTPLGIGRSATAGAHVVTQQFRAVLGGAPACNTFGVILYCSC